jgi:hypothetical protein
VAVSFGPKRQGLSSAEAKNDGAMLSLPHMSSQRDAYLVKPRNNFTFPIFRTEPFAARWHGYKVMLEETRRRVTRTEDAAVVTLYTPVTRRDLSPS